MDTITNPSEKWINSDGEGGGRGGGGGQLCHQILPHQQAVVLGRNVWGMYLLSFACAVA